MVYSCRGLIYMCSEYALSFFLRVPNLKYKITFSTVHVLHPFLVSFVFTITLEERTFLFISRDVHRRITYLLGPPYLLPYIRVYVVYIEAQTCFIHS